MEDSKILVAMEEGHVLVQVLGRGSFQNAHLLKSFCQEMIKGGAGYFLLNLRECTYLDSTFLGTLAGLGIKLRDAKGTFKVINASQRNLELLQNLGLDRILTVQSTPTEVSGELKKLEGTPLDKTTSGQQMLEAHETLMGLDPKNVAKFKDVVAYLKEDLGISS